MCIRDSIHTPQDTLDVLSREEMAFTVEVMGAVLHFLLSSNGA